MQQQDTRYTAYMPDENGLINYSTEEDKIWEILYKRQIKIIQNFACDDFIHGLENLQLKSNKVAQALEVSQQLFKTTGWVVEPVGALINFKRFFQLLSEKKFPAASFIRRQEDLDYLPEPDIFHEIFGHCPNLTDANFAEFTHKIGELGVTLEKVDYIMLARLYWFTVEFGLINTTQGLRIYGAGILSSKEETEYALLSNVPLRKKFDLVEVLRTPYRYDEKQKIYFIIDSFKDLYNLVSGEKLQRAFKKAKELGPLPSLYEDKIISRSETSGMY